MLKQIHTDKAPQAIGPYSQAIVANGFVFCSGQVGVNPQTKTLADDVEKQTRQVMKNLQEVLKAAGVDFSYVVKTTIYLKNIADFPKVNTIYGEYFPEDKPARATVEVSSLPKGSFSKSPLVEIDAIAITSK